MGRKKDEATESPKTVEALNDEQLQTLFFQHKRKLKALIASKKLAYEAVTAEFKIAAADGISRKEIEIALKMEEEDGEDKARAAAERLARVARWMGVAMGTQANLFAKDHFDDGRRAAMNDEARKPPPEVAQADTAKWFEGFDEGRVALNTLRAAKFKPLGDQPSTMTQ